MQSQCCNAIAATQLLQSDQDQGLPVRTLKVPIVRFRCDFDDVTMMRKQGGTGKNRSNRDTS